MYYGLTSDCVVLCTVQYTYKQHRDIMTEMFNLSIFECWIYTVRRVAVADLLSQLLLLYSLAVCAVQPCFCHLACLYTPVGTGVVRHSLHHFIIDA